MTMPNKASKPAYNKRGDSKSPAIGWSVNPDAQPQQKTPPPALSAPPRWSTAAKSGYKESEVDFGDDVDVSKIYEKSSSSNLQDSSYQPSIATNNSTTPKQAHRGNGGGPKDIAGHGKEINQPGISGSMAKDPANPP